MTLAILASLSLTFQASSALKFDPASNEILSGPSLASRAVLSDEDQAQLDEILADHDDTSVTYVSAEGDKCVLEHTCSICVSQPEVRVRARYPPECQEAGGDTMVRNCVQRSSRVERVEKKFKICSEKMSQVCDSPCFNCPKFCRPFKQFWCEDGFKVSLTVKVRSKR